MVARGVPTRGLIALALTAALIATGSAAGDDRADRDPAAHTPSPAFAHALSRVVSVRVHHTRISTVRNTNARRIGRSLACLHPTWVTGPLRYARNQYPTHDEARAWREIRRIVQGASPTAQFDVVLNALQYRTPAAVTATMRRLRAKLGNEGWFFDFFSTRAPPAPADDPAPRSRRRTRTGNGSAATSSGSRASGRCPLQRRLPTVQDSVFHLNLPAVRGSRQAQADPLPPAKRPGPTARAAAVASSRTSALAGAGR